jgi:DNA-binding MarR family transcriptional regulator
MHVHADVVDTLDDALRATVGIPGAWYEALIEIALAGGAMRMSEFAAETTLTRSGATRFVDRLEAAGLVQRQSCTSDRRAWEVVLTDKGRATQLAADPIVLDVIQDRFGRHISDTEAEVISSALDRMREA